MTPKEKANELQQRFYPFTMDWAIQQSGLEYAKQCALICVYELIKHLPSCEGNPPNLPMNEYDREWWQQVKQEIEKL